MLHWVSGAFRRPQLSPSACTCRLEQRGADNVNPKHRPSAWLLVAPVSTRPQPGGLTSACILEWMSTTASWPQGAVIGPSSPKSAPFNRGAMLRVGHAKFAATLEATASRFCRTLSRCQPMASNEILDLMERRQTSLYRTAGAQQAGQTFRSELPFTHVYAQRTARDGGCWPRRRMAIKSSNFRSCTWQEADATAHLARMPVSLVSLPSPAPAREKAFHQVGAISRECHSPPPPLRKIARLQLQA